MNNTKIMSSKRKSAIHWAAAAALSALVLLLALACEPEPNSGSAGTPAAAPDTPLTLSLSGFEVGPTTGSDPNSDYVLLTDAESAALSFDLSLAPDGATAPQVDITKPAYKSTGTSLWYLWASVNPSRYILSRKGTDDL